MVDDSEEDQLLVRLALERSTIAHDFHAIENGGEAVKYLQGEGAYSDRRKYPVPSLMLVDLKMPPLDGFELLEWTQQNKEYGIIPTIVFSSSCFEHDIERAYNLGASAYITKPPTLTELVSLIHKTFSFWSICRLPTLRQTRCLPVRLSSISKPALR